MTTAHPRPRASADAHAATGGRVTSMKWTLARSPAALTALLQWYPLYDEVVPLLGERRTTLFCHAISVQNDCLICSTFFRRMLIDDGEDPDALRLDELDQLIVDLGRRLATDPHLVEGELRRAAHPLTRPYLAISSGNASCPPSRRISAGVPSRTATASASEPSATPAM